MFELSEYKTLLNQAQGTWEFVRNNEKFELSGIRINGCLLYLKVSVLFFEFFEPQPYPRRFLGPYSKNSES